MPHLSAAIPASPLGDSQQTTDAGRSMSRSQLRDCRSLRPGLKARDGDVPGCWLWCANHRYHLLQGSTAAHELMEPGPSTEADATRAGR